MYFKKVQYMYFKMFNVYKEITDVHEKCTACVQKSNMYERKKNRKTDRKHIKTSAFYSAYMWNRVLGRLLVNQPWVPSHKLADLMSRRWHHTMSNIKSG